MLPKELCTPQSPTFNRMALLSINDLTIGFPSKPGLVRNLNARIDVGGSLGLVGESGSGKSLTSLALMGLLPKQATTSGELLWEDGANLLAEPEHKRQKRRGKDLSMVFQEPMTALNPSMRCGHQLVESILVHQSIGSNDAREQALHWMERVKLPRIRELFNNYPHQLSGGQRQRIMLAMALCNKPRLLIADEPTTALDVTVQRAVLDLMLELKEEMGMAMLFISHDLSVVQHVTQNIAVLYRGELVETGASAELLTNAQHPYTQGLINSKPKTSGNPKRLATVADFLQQKPVDKTPHVRPQPLGQPLLEITDLRTWFGGGGLFTKHQPVRAVDGVSLRITEGETVGLVGESGCGKSTFGRTILGLQPATSGSITYRGTELTQLDFAGWKSLRKEIQIIFQDPYSSLNPRFTVGEALTEPMAVHGLFGTAKQRKARAIELLERVGLGADDLKKYPHAFSGGQRQRIGIARALALEPRLIVCDESVSALDVSVQAQVLNLLNELQEEQGFSYLFISHDLNVVRYMSDKVAVMRAGKLEEFGAAQAVYESPQSAYTQVLLEAVL